MILADNLIMFIPNTLIIIFGLVFQLEVIIAQAWTLYLLLVTFGFAFIPLCVLLAQPYKKLETGFKFTLIGVFAYYMLGFLMLYLTDGADWPFYSFTLLTLQMAIINIMTSSFENDAS